MFVSIGIINEQSFGQGQQGCVTPWYWCDINYMEKSAVHENDNDSVFDWQVNGLSDYFC